MTTRVPSVHKLETELNLDRETARKIRAIFKGKLDPRTVEQTDKWVRRGHSNPSEIEQRLHAADVLLGTHGVEVLDSNREDFWRHAPEVYYCNAGDTYAATLCYEPAYDRVTIASWGDMLEWYEKRGVKFE